MGTLRTNRKGSPSEAINTKLKRGEIIAKENNQGITVLKWKDKRDILVLSTKHSSEMITVKTKRGFLPKPKIVAAYNTAKTSIDLSDQMSAYSSPLRKTFKWNKKLAFELNSTTPGDRAGACALRIQGTRARLQPNRELPRIRTQNRRATIAQEDNPAGPPCCSCGHCQNEGVALFICLLAGNRCGDRTGRRFLCRMCGTSV